MIIFLFIIDQAIALNAQQYDLKNDIKDSLRLTDYINRTIIQPAVENLRITSANDPNLLKWYDLIQLETNFADTTGPSAFATMENGNPIVHIDMMFLLEVFFISDVAGLLSSNISDTSIMYNLGFQYGTKLGEALKSGRSLPALEANFNALGIDDKHKVMAESMSAYSFAAAIQFIILHEIGHHQLGHFARDWNDLAESRAWELAADTWAIEKMLQLGYSLHPLESIFIAFTLEEEIKRAAGCITPMNLSTHPSWTQRLENLHRFPYERPSSFGNWICILIIESSSKTGKYYPDELWVPRHSMPGVLCQYSQFNSIIQMPVEHALDGSIHIYGRTSNKCSEYIITNLQSIYPNIKHISTDLSNGEKITTEFNGYQFDIAYLMNSPLKEFPGLTVRDILLLDPSQYFKQYLLLVESKTEIINRALEIHYSQQLNINNTMVRYSKGSINMPDATREIKNHSELEVNQLKKLLGFEKYQRLQEYLLSSPLIINGLKKILNI